MLLLVSLVAQRHLQDLAPVFLLPLVQAVLFLAARDHPQVLLLLNLPVLLPLPHDRPVLFRVALPRAAVSRPVLFRVALPRAAVSRAVLFLAARDHPQVLLLLNLPVLSRHLFQQLIQLLGQVFGQVQVQQVQVQLVGPL